MEIKVKNRGGRPSKISSLIIGKLEETASLDCTVKEMCFYAGINPDTYYAWIKKDKKLSDRLTALRNSPTLKARREVVKGLSRNPEFSLKYLERKKADEFSLKQQIDQKVDISVKSVHLEVIKIIGDINNNQSEIKQIGNNPGSKKHIRKQVVEVAELIQNKKQKQANHKPKNKHHSKTNLRGHKKPKNS